MISKTIPCATCSGTGWTSREDRHTETNRDVCTTCGGTGQVPTHPGERREPSWPDAVPGAAAAADPPFRCHKGDVEVLAARSAAAFYIPQASV